MASNVGDSKLILANISLKIVYTSASLKSCLCKISNQAMTSVVCNLAVGRLVRSLVKLASPLRNMQGTF